MESLADFGLTEMQLEIKSLCRRIGEEKIVPVREHHDETGEFPHDIVKVFAEAGLQQLAHGQGRVKEPLRVEGRQHDPPLAVGADQVGLVSVGQFLQS